MAEKYYTPKIEEFFVGFEYEEFWNDQWDKRIYSIDSFICDGSQDEPYEIEEINPNFHRVKYLDKDDIEDLGYGFRTFLWGFESSDGNIIIEVEDIDDMQKGTIDIYCVQDLRFKGRIKNKSEIAKILKQLDI